MFVNLSSSHWTIGNEIQEMLKVQEDDDEHCEGDRGRAVPQNPNEFLKGIIIICC